MLLVKICFIFELNSLANLETSVQVKQSRVRCFFLTQYLFKQSLVEHQSEKDMINSFPCSASPVVYLPPSATDVAEKVGDASGKASLDRRASIIQRKGYTSDEDLDDLDSPLTSIINKNTPTQPSIEEGTQKESAQTNVRYKLLREVWSG